jgi:hypothetical protein
MKISGFVSDHEYGKGKKCESAKTFSIERHDPQEKSLILNYLQAGAPIAIRLDVIRAALGEALIIGSLEYRTDGSFIWPDYIIYYIEKFDFKLDADFVDHMKNNFFQMPNVSDEVIENASAILSEFHHD